MEEEKVTATEGEVTPADIPSEPVPSEEAPIQTRGPAVTEEIRTTGTTVEKVEIRETVVESYSPGNTAALEEELAQVEAAILDLPNFTARRLANLEDRKAELTGYLSAIGVL